MRWMSGLIFLAVVLWLAIALSARSPQELDAPLSQRPPPRAVRLEAAKPVEPKERPQAPRPRADLALAPERMSADPSVVSNGFGLGFGSGAVAGGGTGLGQSTAAVAGSARPDSPARVVARAPLGYPEEARRLGVSGEVVLRILISEQGQPVSVEVAGSTPNGVFDRAAREAIRGWRFEPAVRNGQAVSGWTTQRIRYELN